MNKTKETNTNTIKLNAAQKSWITRRAKAEAMRNRALKAWATRRAKMKKRVSVKSNAKTK